MKRSPALPQALATALALVFASGACSTPRSDDPGAAPDTTPLDPPAPTEFRPVASGDMLYLWSGGMDALLVDPKDHGVRDALRHMGARMLELPEELEEPEFPGDAIDLALAAFMGPMSLSVGPAEDPDSGMPIRAQMEFRNATPEEARMRADRLTRVMSSFEMPSLGVDEAIGLSRLDFGMFQVLHGVALAGRADTVVIAANGLEVRERDLGTLDLPAGVEPAMAFRFDYESLADMIDMFAGPEAADTLRSMGMGDIVIQGGFGHGSDRSYGSMRTIDWVPMARTTNALPSGSIEPAALAAIPRDATMALVTRTNLASIVHALNQATADSAMAAEDMVVEENEAAELPANMDPLLFLRELTGLDVERDLIANLGETFGLYMSDATGGGGFFSTVAFVRVADEPALRAAIERLEGRLEDMAADQGLSGLAMRHSQHAGADITTVSVSGWPIPIEPSWAIRDGWMFASASAQGLRAALDQAAQSSSDITDNERFRAEVSGSLDDLVSLSYVDVPRFARDAYPFTVMIGSALSNGISSVAEPDRVPVGIVPSYAEFLRGSHATLALGRIEGDDLVIQSCGDRSLLVQVAGMTGAVGPLPLMLMGIGAFAGESSALNGAEASEMDWMQDGTDFDDMNMDEEMQNDLGIDTQDLITDPPSEEPK